MIETIQPTKTFTTDSLPVRIYASESDMATDVAKTVHDYLVQTIAAQGEASAILATGNSQIQFLHTLVELGGIDWGKMTLFHMDEYLGVDENHSACFRRYMRERVESKVNPKVFHYLGGDAPEPIAECERYELLLKAQRIDICCMGVGENGHIAFNDPPVANFEDERLVKIVELDVACRRKSFPRLRGRAKVCTNVDNSRFVLSEESGLRGAGATKSRRREGNARRACVHSLPGIISTHTKSGHPVLGHRLNQ